MTIVTIDAGAIQDWDDFHSAFSKAFGFPSFYGRNMDAWIDCLTHLDDAESGMTAVTVDPGAVLTLQIDRIDVLADRCPEAYAALIECSAFVNWRRVESGASPILALAFRKR